MEATATPALLSLHLLVDQPEGVLCDKVSYVVALLRRQFSQCDQGSSPNCAIYVSYGSYSIHDLTTHIVNRMLMSKSQLHPVMNKTAAGGSRIATWDMDPVQ